MDRLLAESHWVALSSIPKRVRPSSEEALPWDIRLARALRAKGRFRGRAALEARAKAGRGNEAFEAILDLEIALELISHEAFFRDLEKVNPERGLGKRRKELRRYFREALGSDPLWSRPLQWARLEVAKKRAKAAYDSAGFRAAHHGHRARFELVPEGEEWALCSTAKDFASKHGLPASYRYRVTVSRHVIRYSTAIFRAPPSGDGVLWLSPTTSIRQGRGTSLSVKRGSK